MGNKVRFELNIEGLDEIMRSGEMQGHLASAAHAVANAAGEEYDSRVYVGSYAAGANIFPSSRKAAIDNYRNNSLLRALGSVGLSMHK